MATIDIGEARRITSEKEAQYGLPAGTLFKQSGIESSYNANAVSPKGARGYFQFMDPTAKKYGVTVGDFASEADGAARYMRDNLVKYSGNIDLALADYNGGPKAAAALAKGKPWAETADYLAKFHGGANTVPDTPVSKQFTTIVQNDSGASPSASQLYNAEQKQRAEYGGLWNTAANLPNAIATGFKLDNTVYNFFQDRGIRTVDENWQWTKENTEFYLSGIPQQHWDYILQSKSDQEAQTRKSRMVAAMEQEAELGKMGVAGFGGRLVGGLVDLPTLIGFVPGMGGEGLLTASSRIANAARMGLITAAGNTAFEAATMSYRPTATTENLYWAAAMGLGLGAAMGASVNPAKLAAMRLAEENKRLGELGLREAKKAQIKELDDRGLQPGPGREGFLEGGIKAPEGKNPGVGVVIPGEGGAKPREVMPPDGPHRLPDPPPERPGSIPKEPPPEAPVEPPKGSRKESYGAEWDTPRYTEHGGNDQLLVLPPAKKVSELIAYVKQFSKNEDFKKILTQLENGIDLRKLKYKTIEKGQRFGTPGMDMAIHRAKGAVHTPGMSEGNDISMFLRSHSFAEPGRHPMDTVGLNEETFIHEMVHVASVYKLRLNDHGGIEAVTPGIREAATALKDLHSELLVRAEKQFGPSWKYELKGRLGTNLDNEKEMIAYGLTNRNFQNWMHSQKLDGAPDKSLWTRFTNSLRKLLGIDPKEHTAFTKLIDLTQTLVQQGGIKRTKISPELEAAHGGIDAATVAAANEAEIPTIFGWGLGLENRLMKSSMMPAVRSLASKLFGTTIGYKDHGVVGAHAWETATSKAAGWSTQIRKVYGPELDAWMKERGFKQAQTAEAHEAFGTEVSNYIRGMEGDYAPQVKKVGDQIRKVLDDAREHINNPLKDVGGTKRGLTETEVLDPETGVATLVGKLESNPNYLPRKHDINKWNDMMTSFGPDSRALVEGWWGRAYQAGREGVSDEAAARFGKWYVRTVEDAHANRSQDFLADMMRGQDKEALKRSLMDHGGFTEGEAYKVMDSMFPRQTDNGRQASLKHRNAIDESYTEEITLPNGNKRTIGLNDFIHTNALDVVEPYLRRTAGSIALARHLDVYKAGDIGELIAGATRNELGNGFLKPHQIEKIREDLQFAFDRVQGIPQEDFGPWKKAAQMFQDFNIIRMMGGAVWNQATELSQIVGSMGWKATLGASSELRALRRDLANGRAPHAILDHLENTIGGVGAEYVERMQFGAKDDWVRNLGDSAKTRAADYLDNKLSKFAKGVLDYTGMTPLMIQQKRVHAVALVNHFVNVAKGAESKLLTPERLAWMGMSQDDFKKVLAQIDKHTVPKAGEYGKSHKMDFAAWVKESPETHSMFMQAIHRESRRVVQENDLASMIPIMGSTLGKTVFQFQNFSMHGWNKSLMFAMNHRDWSTLSTVLHGSFLASLAYMGRTALAAQGMDSQKKQEFLDKRFTTKQIVANSFGRISQASLLPVAFDTVSPFPMFNGMRTTSDLSSVASNPTYQFVNGLISTKKLIRNGLSDESQTTSKDIQTWGKLLPLNNVVPISTFLNSIANDYPHSEHQGN